MAEQKPLTWCGVPLSRLYDEHGNTPDFKRMAEEASAERKARKAAEDAKAAEAAKAAEDAKAAADAAAKAAEAAKPKL